MRASSAEVLLASRHGYICLSCRLRSPPLRRIPRERFRYTDASDITESKGDESGAREVEAAGLPRPSKLRSFIHSVLGVEEKMERQNEEDRSAMKLSAGLQKKTSAETTDQDTCAAAQQQQPEEEVIIHRRVETDVHQRKSKSFAIRKFISKTRPFESLPEALSGQTPKQDAILESVDFLKDVNLSADDAGVGPTVDAAKPKLPLDESKAMKEPERDAADAPIEDTKNDEKRTVKKEKKGNRVKGNRKRRQPVLRKRPTRDQAFRKVQDKSSSSRENPSGTQAGKSTVENTRGGGDGRRTRRRSDPSMAPVLGFKAGVLIEKAEASMLEILPIDADQPPVPGLSYGLERVLFNPGVYQLQDPRSRVYNFDPYLQNIMPVAEFDFNALKEYITSSRDQSLKKLAKEYGKRYVGSTSSMTDVLAHFHFLLSQWRPINSSMMSKNFPAPFQTFTELQRSPSAIFLRWKDGSYAIDADKEFATANVLSMLGKSMEKLLTLPTEDFERYRKSSSDQYAKDEQIAPESYHYSTMGDFLMRSQLDAHDPRLPGTGMFDLKTRAVVSVRMDVKNYEEGTGYQIKSQHGEYESYEREFFDMIRAAFLKYSMQVRMGRMDGIFVAFHNVQRIFGFQYISLPEMDNAVHGQWDTALGDQEFKLSLDLLNKILDKATAKFPEMSIRLHFETREAKTPFMYIFAEPMTEERVTKIQSRNDTKLAEFEREILGLNKEEDPRDAQINDRKWEDVQASIQEEMSKDETSLENSSRSQNIAKEESSEPQARENNYEAAAAVSGSSHSQIDVDESAETDDTIVASFQEQDNERITKGDKDPTAGGYNATKENQGIDSEKMPDDSSTEVYESEESPIGDVAERQSQPSKEGTPSVATSDDAIQASHKEAACIPSEENAQSPILAMTLVLRNKVNDKDVLRPNGLSATDKWTVEYSLAEMSSESRAKTLYEACQLRRKKKFDDEPEERRGQEILSTYVKRLRELSVKGRAWRSKQDEKEREGPVHVLGRERLARGEKGDGIVAHQEG